MFVVGAGRLVFNFLYIIRNGSKLVKRSAIKYAPPAGRTSVTLSACNPLRLLWELEADTMKVLVCIQAKERNIDLEVKVMSFKYTKDIGQYRQNLIQ